MIRSFTLWLKKRKNKAAFAKEFRTLVFRNAWSDLEEDIDTHLLELESFYLKRGLTQQDLEQVKNSIGSVRVE